MRNERDALLGSVALLKEQNKDLQAVSSSNAEDISRLKQLNEELHAVNSSNALDISKVRERSQQLEQQLEESEVNRNAAIQELHEHAQKRSEVNERLSNNLAALNGQIECMQGEIAAREEENNKLRECLSSSEESKLQLETECESMARQNKTLSDTVSMLKGEAGQLQDRVAQTEQDKVKLENENQVLAARAVDLQRVVQELRASGESQQEKSASDEEEHEKHEAIVARALQDKERLEKENQSLSSRVADLQRTVQECVPLADHQAILKEHRILQQELETMRENIIKMGVAQDVNGAPAGYPMAKEPLKTLGKASIASLPKSARNATEERRVSPASVISGIGSVNIPMKNGSVNLPTGNAGMMSPSMPVNSWQQNIHRTRRTPDTLMQAPAATRATASVRMNTSPQPLCVNTISGSGRAAQVLPGRFRP